MIYAINSSPRKNANTATLLQHALEGAQAGGMETRLVHLHELDFRGCVSCFSCKRKGGKLGQCAMNDGLSPLLKELDSADGIILGSPIYYVDVTASMRAFLERFLFSHMVYNKENKWRFPKTMPFACVYTWGAPDEWAAGLRERFRTTEVSLSAMLGSEPVVLHSYDTWQFKDYSLYEADQVDLEAKRIARETVFPRDCQTAREIGEKMARIAASSVV